MELKWSPKMCHSSFLWICRIAVLEWCEIWKVNGRCTTIVFRFGCIGCFESHVDKRGFFWKRQGRCIVVSHDLTAEKCTHHHFHFESSLVIISVDSVTKMYDKWVGRKLKALGVIGVLPCTVLKVNVGNVYFPRNISTAWIADMHLFVHCYVILCYKIVNLMHFCRWTWHHFVWICLESDFTMKLLLLLFRRSFLYKHSCLRHSAGLYPAAEGLAALLCHTSWSFSFYYAFDI